MTASDDTTSSRSSAKSVYIDEAQVNQARFQSILNFTYSSTKAAALMLIAAVLALIVANSGAYHEFLEFWENSLGIIVGTAHLSLPLAEIINDIFMAVFFLLVGLEIKYEMTAGDLVNINQALLPIIAAFGGVCAPIVIYSIFNIHFADTAHGWGIPTATDIAFALGILALLGNRVPNGVRVFLSTLAVADDIIAILVIALFYGQTPSFMWLGGVALIMVVLVLMNRFHVYSLAPYLLVGVALWYCVFMSGVHSTIAGVLLAFTIPASSHINLGRFSIWSRSATEKAQQEYDPNVPVSAQEVYLKTVSSLSDVARKVVPPATRLEHTLYPWVYFFILPLFALTNADVSLLGSSFGELVANPVFFGVFFGLLLGKPLGILLFSFLVIKFRIARLPENTSWMHMVGAGILGGVGFTMAIFVANLAFPDAAHVVNAKLAILLASATAGIIGFLFLAIRARADQKRGVAYLSTASDAAAHQTAHSETIEHSKELLDQISSPLARQEIEAAQRDSGSGVTEVVVELGSDQVFGVETLLARDDAAGGEHSSAGAGTSAGKADTAGRERGAAGTGAATDAAVADTTATGTTADAATDDATDSPDSRQ